MPDMMKLADVKIRKGFNARENGLEDPPDIRELAGSIKLVGVLQPVTLDAEGYLVSGHRRVAAAQLAGLTEIPYQLETGDEKRRLAVHGAENTARKDLSPAEEAELIGRLLDPNSPEGGYTEEGAAQVLGVSKALVTRRKVLLELPKDLRSLWGPGGDVPLDVVPLVAEIVGKVPVLADIILHAERSRAPERSQAELEQQREELRDQAYEDGMEDDAYEDELVPVDEAPPVTKLLTEPIRYLNTLQRIYTVPKGKRQQQGVPKWPNDVVVATDGVQFADGNLQALGVTEKMRQRVVDATAKARQANVWHLYLRLGEADMDAGRAAGVTIRLGETEFIYDLPWLKARIKSDMIPAFEEEAERRIKEMAERRAAERPPSTSKVPDAELTPQQLVQRESQRAQREKEKEWKQRAVAANEELGRALLNAWSEVKVDAKLAKLFVEASLGPRPSGSGGSYSSYGSNHRPAAQLAAAGLRYVMPGWPTVVAMPTKANPNKTRTDYLEVEEAEKKLWAWFDQAKTVEEIFGRAIVIHAAAMWANERVVAQSHRVSFYAHGTTVLPTDPAAQLRKLTAGSVPASMKKLAKDIADFDKGSR